jgi:SAM-dependent methyltransferase
MVETEVWGEEYWDSKENHYRDGDLRRELIGSFLETPSKRKSILDLGCSNGGDLERFQQWYERAVGLDSSEGCVQNAKSKGLEAYLGDLADVDKIFREGEFDTIHSAYAFHLQNTLSIDIFFNKIFELLKPGGFFLGVAPNLTLMNEEQIQFVSNPLNGNSSNIDYDLFGDRKDIKTIPVKGVPYWTPRDVCIAMKYSGLKFVDTYSFNDGGISSSNYSCSRSKRESPQFHDSILYLGRKS